MRPPAWGRDKLCLMIRPVVGLLLGAVCWSQPQSRPLFPNQEADWVAHDFAFKSGEKLAELHLHYTTLGAPTRDAAGHVNNAVIIMHGTGAAAIRLPPTGLRR